MKLLPYTVFVKSKFVLLDKTGIHESSSARETQEKAGKLSQSRDLIGFRSISSVLENETNDLPGLVFMHDLSRDDLYALLPKMHVHGGSNQDAIRDLVTHRTGNPETSKEMVEKSKSILKEAVAYLENELEIGIPNGIKNIIEGFSNTGDIVKFFESAQGIKASQNGPIICGILKVADCITEIDRTPELENLIQKSDRFRSFFSDVAFTDSYRQEQQDLEYGDQKSSLKKQYQNPFLAREIDFNVKNRNRIIGKLLRKQGKVVTDIVRDGVRARIVVPESEQTPELISYASEYCKSLPGYQLVEKKRKGANSAGNKNRTDLTLLGEDPYDGTHIEVVIQSEREYITHEHGVKSHEPYEWVQNFQVMCRLWGSVGKSRYDRKLKQLSQKKYFTSKEDKTGYTISLETLKRLFEDHFYFNTETGRYHWYEYDFRTNGSGVFTEEYQEKRNIGTIRAIQDRAREFSSELGSVPFNTWSDILNNNRFPSDEQLEPFWILIHKFFESIPSVPKLINRCLKIQINANKIGGPSNGASPHQWGFIFQYKDWPQSRRDLDENKVLKTLKREPEVFKFLIQILQTKLESEEIVNTTT